MLPGREMVVALVPLSPVLTPVERPEVLLPMGRKVVRPPVSDCRREIVEEALPDDTRPRPLLPGRCTPLTALAVWLPLLCEGR